MTDLAQKITDLQEMLQSETVSFEEISPRLREIMALFEPLSDSEKSKYLPEFDQINLELNRLLETEIKNQASIKAEIHAMNKRSNAFEAYQNTTRLGS